jgi:hypothetical protein
VRPGAASQLMPPAPIAEAMSHPEAPPTHPCGPNTNFKYPTPMPFRFEAPSLDAHNARHKTARKEHPIYETTASEIGKLQLTAADFPMRWYGLEGRFTNYCTSDGAVLPKTKVNTALNTGMDRSDVHHNMDQGWKGDLGLTDFNISNREYARHVVRAPRK